VRIGCTRDREAADSIHMSRHSIARLVSEELTDDVVRDDVTMPIDITELVPMHSQTIPIQMLQILSTIPLEGGTTTTHRSWFGRVWDTLTRRVEPAKN
jgi:hypothetical protein